MNGWLPALLLVALTVIGILLFTPLRRQLWPAVLAALVLGLAGYAWQGQPELVSAPAKPIAAKTQTAASLIAMRADMDAQFGSGRQWLILSDSYARKGNYQSAAALLETGLQKSPQNGDLWAALGVVLLLAGDGEMSPPAEMAFAKARKFAPVNRAPDYFAGLVALFEGRPAVTLETWQKLVDGAPQNAIWKPKVESQLNGLESMLQSAQPTAAN